MVKYSFELKLISNYLSNQGCIRFLSKKYRVKANYQIVKRIKAYTELGKEGLLRSRKIKNYSVQFKFD